MVNAKDHQANDNYFLLIDFIWNLFKFTGKKLIKISFKIKSN